MNGNQQTAPAEAADGDRLPPPTNRVRDEAPRPLPSWGRRLSPRRLLNLGLCESAPSSPKPRPGAAFARPGRLSHCPAPPRAQALGSARASCGLFPWVPNIPQRQGAPSKLETGWKRGRFASRTLLVSSPRATGGRRRTSGGGHAVKVKRGFPRPPSLTTPRSSTRRDRTRGGARRRLSRGRARAVLCSRAPEASRRPTKDLTQCAPQGSRPLSPGRARRKGNNPIFSSSGAPFFILNKNN